MHNPLIQKLATNLLKINIIKFVKVNILEIIRFGISGFLVMLSYAISFFLFAKYSNMHIVIINTLAYLISSVFSFTLHKYFSFKHKSKIVASEVVKFLFIAISSYIISNLIVYTVYIFNAHYYVAITLNVTIIPIANYILMKFYLFINKS